MRKTSLPILLAGFILSFSSCEQTKTEDEVLISTSKKPISQPYRIEIIALQNGFGYQLYEKNKLIIDQQTIPAIQGNQAFLTYEAAEKCAEFCLQKIKKGIFPPTITVEDLNSLGIK